MVYYRRHFAAARRLLWDFWKDHPADVRVLAYAAMTMLPSTLIARLRGTVPAAGGNSGDLPLREWSEEVMRIRQKLAQAV